MNTPEQRIARSTIRFAGLAVGVALLLGACGDSSQQEQESGAVTPPAKTVQLAQVVVAE